MTVFRTLAICTFLLGLATTAGALNPDRHIRQLAHRSWSEKDGYPGKAQALAQTTDGFLWIGSDMGLFRFDGVNFERYVSRSGDKLPANRVFGLLATPDGSLWISYNTYEYQNRICVLRTGNVKCYGYADGVASSPTSLVEDHEGTVWADTETGLLRFSGTRWEHIGSAWNFPERVPHETSESLFVDRSGTLWVGFNHTVFYLKRGSKRFEPTGAYAGSSSSIAEAPDGTMWLADDDSYVRPISTSVSATSAAIARCEAKTPIGTPPKCPEDLQAIKIITANALLFDRNGSLWITTDSSGIGRVPHPEQLGSRPNPNSNGALERFNSKDGLSADNCDPILEDREGNIWVATRDGLDQFRDTALAPVPLPSSIIQVAIAPADGGDIWIACTYTFIARTHGDAGGVSLVHADAFKPYRDPAGVTWLMGNVLGRWTDGSFRTVAHSPEGQNRGSFGAWQVVGDRFGTLWAFSTGYGFYSLVHHEWKAWATPPELAKQRVANMFSDSTGHIWVSTYEGHIVTMDKGNVVDYPLNRDSPLRYVKAFAEHAPQQIWAGGPGGLVLVDSGSLRVIKPAGSDFSEDITGIVDAKSQGLWLNTENGVVHVPEDEIDRALQDPSYRFRWERFTSSDGIPGQTQSIGPYPKAIQGTDGRIWFTATEGLAWVDPKKAIPRNNLPPPVSITSVSADGSPHLQLAALRLPARTESVQISYSALSLSVPERVRFKYRLDGVDKDWQDVGTRREAFYTQLGPRQYRFQVIACNQDGVWNKVGAVVEFSIAPAWYQTYWFFALCTAIVFLTVWVLYRLRLRQVARAMSIRFDERLSERTRIARDFHDTLLQTIQGTKLMADSALKQGADPVRMRGAMEQISVWMGQATEDGRAALNSLRTSTTETNDLADAFRRAMEECRINGFIDASFSVAGTASEMHPIVRDEVYRIGYEAIRNACVHSHGTQLQVELTYADDLSLRVRDNGVGIEAAILNEGKEGHFGLQGMRERAQRIMAKLIVDTSEESGTDVKLVVPGSIIYRKPSFGRGKIAAIRSLFKRNGPNPNSIKH